MRTVVLESLFRERPIASSASRRLPLFHLADKRADHGELSANRPRAGRRDECRRRGGAQPRRGFPGSAGGLFASGGARTLRSCGGLAVLFVRGCDRQRGGGKGLVRGHPDREFAPRSGDRKSVV